MRLGHISDEDNLFRATIHPLAFKSKNRFNHGRVFYLDFKADGSLLGSLIWERYAPSTRYIHEYGCRLAFGQNQRYRDEGKEKYRRVYCGSYTLSAKAIRMLPKLEMLNEVLTHADVVHHVEAGEIAHADLKISVKATHHNDEGTKTAIIDRLWHSCRGPLSHKCECDHNIDSHPSSNLELPPQGEYSDTRSSFTRCWHIVTFVIINFVWGLFTKYYKH
jgi:hypothetical protein